MTNSRYKEFKDIFYSIFLQKNLLKPLDQLIDSINTDILTQKDLEEAIKLATIKSEDNIEEIIDEINDEPNKYIEGYIDFLDKQDRKDFFSALSDAGNDYDKIIIDKIDNIYLPKLEKLNYDKFRLEKILYSYLQFDY